MKKKQLDGGFLIILRKTLRIMRLSMFLIVISTAMAFSANSYSQNAKLTMDLNNVTVNDVLRSIEHQSEFLFFYQEKHVDLNRKVTLHVTEQDVETILDQLFDGTDNIYVINDRQIVIGVAPRKELEKQIQRFDGYVKPALVQPQQKEITGRVTDAGDRPLPGVSVIVKGTTIGIVTDANGEFTLNIPLNAEVLQFSFVGMKTQEIPIEGRTTFSTVMEEETVGLDEVVAIGYGAQRKSDLTGSVVRINMDDKVSAGNMNLLQSIQGDVPGLNVTGGGLVAGDEPSISVRGRTSLSASDRPLIVLDGIIYNGSVSNININDVETIDILKDASSAAVYGSRSANGVMLITTKRGRTERPRFTINSSYGFQDYTKYLPVMNAEEYAIRLADYDWQQKLYTWYRNNPTSPTDFGGRPVRPDLNNRTVVASFLKSEEERANYIEGGHDINWLDEVTRTAPVTNIDLSVQNMTERSNYYISGSYTDQKGVLSNDQFKRATVHTRLESKVADWLTLGLTSSYSHRDYSGLGSTLERARSASPLANMYNSIGEYPAILNQEAYQIHPLANNYVTDYDVTNNLFVLGNAKIAIPKIKGLIYDLNYSSTFNTVQSNTFYPATTIEGATNMGNATKFDTDERSWILDNIVTYSGDFAEEHRVNVTLLYSREQRTSDNSDLFSQGFGNATLGYNAVQLGNLQTVSSGAWEENSLAYMARVNYVFKDRYMFTATARRDGFSGFGATNKFATFPSVSLAWVASDESFMDNMDGWLNLLKLRISYGKNGNQGIGRYSSLSRMATTNYIFGSSTAVGVYPSTMGNESLAWETTTSFNVGLDYAVLDHRISGSIDVYKAETSDVLVLRTIPSYTGYNNVWTNIGGIDNKGIELALTTLNIESPLRWETRFSFSLNRDKITRLYGGPEDRDIGNSWFVGEPISAIYDYKMAGGVWTEQELYNNQITTAGFYPGHFKLEDLNDDGIIDPNNDRSIIGYKTPNYRFSINNTLTYKNFTLNFFINSIMGGNGYYLENNAALLTYTNRPGNGRNTDETFRKNQYNIVQYWTPDNGVSNTGGIFYAPPIEAGVYESRSFIRLQDVSLTYTLGRNILDILKLSGCDIFLSSKNPYIWTKWSGWDPETALVSSQTMKSYTAGIRLSW